MKPPIAIGRQDGMLVKNTCIKCGNIPTGIGYYKNDTTGEIICIDCALGQPPKLNPTQKIANVLVLLDEIEKAEQQNWKTGQAMPVIHRKLKRAVSRAELMSHSWGRIKLARQIREMLTK